MGNRDILLRLQNNIKVRLIQSDQLEARRRHLERMLLIAPKRAVALAGGRRALWPPRQSARGHRGAGALLAVWPSDERLRDSRPRASAEICKGKMN